MGETLNTVLHVVVSFMGGGVVAGLMNWIRTDRADRKILRIQNIKDQLEKLYGPLYYFTSQNEECFKMNSKFLDAMLSDKVQVDDAEGNRRSLLRTEEVQETIALSNEYAAIVIRNNQQVMEIFQNNWQHVDFRDIAVFRQMMIDYLRHKVEVEPGGKMRTPLLICQLLGNIPFMRSEFIERIKTRVEEKQGELLRLAK